MDKQKRVERRRNRRYKAAPGAFAAIEDTSMAGQIVDMSMGGLCFKYLENETIEKKVSPSGMILALVGKKHYVEQLDFRIVRDYPVVNVSPFSTIGFRKCHLQFIEMNYMKQSELDGFIFTNIIWG